MINDQAAGLGGKVVAGTRRDSLYVLDVLYDRDGGKRPEMIVTDTASYSDIVFGLLTLAGYVYAPQLADLPDQKMWRVDARAHYGPFRQVARGRVDPVRIERHWDDILRIIGSIHTGAVRAYDVIRMLSRDGRPTPLGDAIAHHGPISKSLHILRLADEPAYRRQIKAQANLQEGRHSLARKIFHGKAGQLYQNYQDGMEDQLGALGLVLNALVLFNTRYMDAAVKRLRTNGFDVRDADVARLSPFVRDHVNMLGRYSFTLPELPDELRPLREPNADLVTPMVRGTRRGARLRSIFRQARRKRSSTRKGHHFLEWRYLSTRLQTSALRLFDRRDRRDRRWRVWPRPYPKCRSAGRQQPECRDTPGGEPQCRVGSEGADQGTAQRRSQRHGQHAYRRTGRQNLGHQRVGRRALDERRGERGVGRPQHSADRERADRDGRRRAQADGEHEDAEADDDGDGGGSPRSTAQESGQERTE
ncbi:hypothetical protein EHYA_10349 [Embleya hyalina]|uniref:Tn3 transposase DDE domain-containing protein n=1 Tax=Embleya hyalina TaxID=516124 RepID=A0A401Z6S4_9ACTN|nr:hypothetical protein EHYA_10349 [Embleya hyalina]